MQLDIFIFHASILPYSCLEVYLSVERGLRLRVVQPLQTPSELTILLKHFFFQKHKRMPIYECFEKKKVFQFYK